MREEQATKTPSAKKNPSSAERTEVPHSVTKNAKSTTFTREEQAMKTPSQATKTPSSAKRTGVVVVVFGKRRFKICNAILPAKNTKNVTCIREEQATKTPSSAKRTGVPDSATKNTKNVTCMREEQATKTPSSAKRTVVPDSATKNTKNVTCMREEQAMKAPSAKKTPSSAKRTGVPHSSVTKNARSATFTREEPAGKDFPEGWVVHYHERKSGASAGKHVDKYWYTKTGKKLRSRPEIMRFLDYLKVAEGDEDAAYKYLKSIKKKVPKQSKQGDSMQRTGNTYNF